MRKFLLLFTPLLLVLTAGCQPGAGNAGRPLPKGADLHFKLHWAGGRKLAADTNAPALGKMYATAASSGFLEQVVTQFSRAPFLLLSSSLPTGATDQMAKIRPLVEDLLQSEGFFQRDDNALIIAAEVTEARSRIWETNLQSVLKNWTGKAAPISANGSWSIKLGGAEELRFARKGGWVVLGLGRSGTVFDQLAKQLQGGQRPVPPLRGNWAEGSVNTARFKANLPAWQSLQFPVVQFALSNRQDYVRTQMRLTYPGGHGWKHEAWLVPTNLIRDPIISFTAWQGIAPLLSASSDVRSLGLKPMPNQAIVWAQKSLPFQTQIVVPSANATNQVREVAPNLAKLLTAQSNLTGTIGWDKGASEMFWSGLPFVYPKLVPIKSGGQQFIRGELFPPDPKSNAAPAELFGQVTGRKDLVMYDWEITQDRMAQWRLLYQLWDIVEDAQLIATNAPSQKWIEGVAPLLGNSGTELTVTSPTEMQLTRRSHGGFTGYELVSFVRWMDSPNFPRFDIHSAPRVAVGSAAGRSRPGQPLPAAGQSKP